MESISTFFKEENDLLYMLGEYWGKEKERTKFVKFMLGHTAYGIEKIAQEAEVNNEFVQKIKATLR